MTFSDLKFLISDQGKLLLKKYASDDEATLIHALLKASKKTSKKEEDKFLSAVVTLLKLRRRAGDKFSKSSKMFFTPLGLEQATGENIARYIASRFKAKWKVVDLTVGIGGNAIFLAERCRQLIAIDKNKVNLLGAEVNARLYGVQDKIKFVLGEAEKELEKVKLIKGTQAFFLDPARDRLGKTKTRSILNSQPVLLEILPKLLAITKNVAVKISPAFDYQELKLLDPQPELEIISEDNTNKVAMLWFGDLKTAERRATIIEDESVFTINDQPEAQPNFTEGLLFYLYLPNKAIIKAHLVDELAIKYGLFKIHPQSPFLTLERNISSSLKMNLWRAFKVITYDRFSWSSLKRFISEQGLKHINIISKQFPIKPDEVYQRLKIKEGGEFFLILTILGDGKRYYMFTVRA